MIYTISAGVTSNGIILNSGGTANVQGTANNITINSGGIENLIIGGNSSGVTINAGGRQVLGEYSSAYGFYAGGIASAVKVNSGGTETLSAGTVTGLTINNGGSAVVYNGGLVINTTVNSGGMEYLSAGVDSGTLTVKNGGIVSGLVDVVSGDTLMVQSGALIAQLEISSGAVVSGSLAESHGAVTVSYGANTGSAALILNNSGTANVQGTADNVVINSGGVEMVNSGGATSGVTINAGGQQVLGEYSTVYGYYAGGNASAVTINSGGKEILSAGTVSGLTVNNGGSAVVYNGGLVVNAIINHGGVVDNVNGFVNNVTVSSGGELMLNNNVGGITLNGGAVLDFVGVVGNAATVNPEGQLLLSHSGTLVETLSLTGDNSNDAFTTSSDNAGGTLVQVKALTTLSTVAYNAGSGQLLLTGSHLTSTGYLLTDFTLKGDGGTRYTLTSGSAIFGTPTSSSAVIQLSVADQLAINGLLNKAGTIANDGATIYKLSAAAGWDSGANAITTQAVSVSHVSAPVISSVAYNAATGVFSVSGANFDNHGSSNGIVLADFKFTGGVGGSYRFNANTDTVSHLTAGGFTITLSSADKAALNAFVNANGVSPAAGAAYHLTATGNWDSDSGAAISTQAVTVSELSAYQTTLASATLPGAIVADSSGNVYVAEGNNSIVELAAGSHAPASLDSLQTGAVFVPKGGAADGLGNVYWVDYMDGNIQELVNANSAHVALVGSQLSDSTYV